MVCHRSHPFAAYRICVTRSVVLVLGTCRGICHWQQICPCTDSESCPATQRGGNGCCIRGQLLLVTASSHAMNLFLCGSLIESGRQSRCVGKLLSGFEYVRAVCACSTMISVILQKSRPGDSVCTTLLRYILKATHRCRNPKTYCTCVKIFLSFLDASPDHS